MRLSAAQAAGARLYRDANSSAVAARSGALCAELLESAQAAGARLYRDANSSAVAARSGALCAELLESRVLLVGCLGHIVTTPSRSRLGIT